MPGADSASGAPAVVGVGIDRTTVGRLREAARRGGVRLVERVLHPGERLRRERAPDPDRVLAEAFAVKEAVLKALGTGWGAGVGFGQVETLDRGGGRLGVRLHGAARERSEASGVCGWHVAVTGEGDAVLAVAVATGPAGLTPVRATR